jgi:hypothetical protein
LYLTPVTVGAHKAVAANAIPKINIIEKLPQSKQLSKDDISPSVFSSTYLPRTFHTHSVPASEKNSDQYAYRTLFPNNTFFGLTEAHITGTTGGWAVGLFDGI